MNTVEHFFEQAQSSSGLFYPNDHIFAVFRNAIEADRAKRALDHQGCPGYEVVSITGEEATNFASDQFVRSGLWGAFVRALSRAIGTEAGYSDHDLAAAKSGAAFIAVHCPSEEAKLRAWKILSDTQPLAARYYSTGGIEHLVGEE